MKFLISYPTDQLANAKLVHDACREVEDAYLHQNVRVETIDWKQNISGGKSERPQDVINEQLSELDAIIVLVGSRLGTSTGKYESGVDEEIAVFVENFGVMNRRIHVLFDKTSEDIHQLDVNELSAIRGFRERLSEEGCLFRDFAGADELKRFARHAISKVIIDVFGEFKALGGATLNRSQRRKKSRLNAKKQTETSPLNLAMEEIGQTFEALNKIVAEEKIEKARVDSDKRSQRSRIVTYLNESDLAFSKMAIRLRENLNTIYGQLIEEVGNKGESSHEAMNLKAFVLLGTAHVGSIASPMLANHLRQRAELVQSLPDFSAELVYSRDRLAQTLSRIADIISESGEMVRDILVGVGWKVEFPELDRLVIDQPNDS